MNNIITKSKKLQLTLAIFKPDICKAPLIINNLRNLLDEELFTVVKEKEIYMQRECAERFYAEHKGKFFYNRLVLFMSSGPIQPLILANFDAIQHWRKLMGPTKVFKTQFEAPNTIRGLYGLTDTRNATHGSDSMENAIKEMKFFYPEFSYWKWMEDEEPILREKYLHNIELSNEEQLVESR